LEIGQGLIIPHHNHAGFFTKCYTGFNRVLGRIFGTKRVWQEPSEDCIMKSFITGALH
jgi:hypothetical protein